MNAVVEPFCASALAPGEAWALIADGHGLRFCKKCMRFRWGACAIVIADQALVRAKQNLNLASLRRKK